MAKKDGKPPARYLEAKERHPEALEAYERFGQALEKAGPLSTREQRLVKLGLAFGARMEGAGHAAVRKALAAGLTQEEIEHAALLGMTTVGFPNGMMFLSWVGDVLEKQNAKD